MGKPLQQTKFHQINRTIKGLLAVGTFKPETVAKEHGISVTTVNMVRRAKTWKGYQKLLAKYNTGRSKKTPVQPEKQLEKSLEQLELNPVEYVTAKHFEEAIKVLSTNTETAVSDAASAQAGADDAHVRLDTNIKRINGFGRIINQLIARKPRWFKDQR